MKKPTDIGTNRTGIAASPLDSRKLVEGAVQGVPNARIDGQALHALRVAYCAQADPVGTLPPPASLKQVATAMVEAFKGHKATVFLDLLGERLAFERTGARLYQAVLAKLEAADPHPGGPTREELTEIREQELAHFHLLGRAIERLGGDPTTMTPCADVVGVASNGLLQVVTDARTTLNQALKIAQIAELADGDGWATLTTLAERFGQDELAAEFQRALEEEERHLALVRAWVARSVEGEAGLEPEEPHPPATAAP